MTMEPRDDLGSPPAYETRAHHLAGGHREALLAKIKKYLTAQQEVSFAYIHGSFIEGRPFRDIDVAVCFGPDIPPDRQLALSIKYAVELTAAVGIDVDVHSLNTASLAFAFHSTRGQLLCSQNDSDRHDFEEDTWIRYLDFEPFLKQNLKDLITPKD